MNRQTNDQPPRWVLAFFRWFCRPEMREYIEGDLVELYHHRRAGLGLAKARWLLIMDVLMLLRPSIIGGPGSRLQQFSIMKNIQWTKLVGFNLLVALMILSPFIPGPSNKLVLVFSVSAQAMGFLGLALVPLGLAWIIVQVKQSRHVEIGAATQKALDRIAIGATLLVSFILFSLALTVPQTMPKVSFIAGMLLVMSGLMFSWRHGAVIILAVACLSCFTFVVLILTLAVFAGVGILQGLLTVMFVAAGIYWLIKGINAMKKDAVKFRQIPFFLVSIPVMAFLVSILLMRPASNFSRNYEIEKNKKLITALEAYKQREGKYPASLDELPDVNYTPSIMGIDRIRYATINDHFTLSFSQWLDWGSLEEIVVYATDDVKNMAKIQGALAAYDTKHADWQYYHCD